MPLFNIEHIKLTTDQGKAIQPLLLLAGFRIHLTKPIDFRTLEAAIREAVAVAG